MKRHLKTLFTSLLILTIAGSAYVAFGGLGNANACGCGGGQAGGGDYVPQRRGPGSFLASTSLVTQEQAEQLLSRHISKLNPELKVGNVNDAGGFYEAEILSRDDEVVQLLGVDKASGRLMLIN